MCLCVRSFFNLSLSLSLHYREFESFIVKEWIQNLTTELHKVYRNQVKESNSRGKPLPDITEYKDVLSSIDALNKEIFKNPEFYRAELKPERLSYFTTLITSRSTHMLQAKDDNWSKFRECEVWKQLTDYENFVTARDQAWMKTKFPIASTIEQKNETISGITLFLHTISTTLDEFARSLGNRFVTAIMDDDNFTNLRKVHLERFPALITAFASILDQHISTCSKSFIASKELEVLYANIEKILSIKYSSSREEGVTGTMYWNHNFDAVRSLPHEIITLWSEKVFVKFAEVDLRSLSTVPIEEEERLIKEDLLEWRLDLLTQINDELLTIKSLRDLARKVTGKPLKLIPNKGLIINIKI